MAEERHRRLLNPFAFPSETELRSILLIWAIVSLCWELGFFFISVVASSAGLPTLGDLPNLERDVWGIQAQGGSLMSGPDALEKREKALAQRLSSLSDPVERDRTEAALVRLSKGAHDQAIVTLSYLFLPFAFLLLVLLFILALYFVRARRLWFVRLAGSKHRESTEYQDALYGLVEEVQGRQLDLGEKPLSRPKFLISRGARGEGQVYGTSRKPLLVLSRAIPLLLRKEIRQHGKPSSIRAFMFHELAHLANRDLNRSYLAEVSWVALLPLLVTLIAALWLTWSSEGIDEPRYHPIVVSLQVLGTLLAIELIRRGLLRSREHFADLRAGLLWNAVDLLRAALHRGDGNGSAEPIGPLHPFIRLWQKHPTFEERREVLDNPGLVFGIGKDAPVLAGLLFGSLFIVAILFTGVLVSAVDASALLAITGLARKYAAEKGLVYAMQFYYRVGLPGWGCISIAAVYGLPLMPAYLLAGTLGVQTQRESVLQMMEGRLHPHPYRALRMPAFLTALGFEAGLLLVPFSLALPGTPWAIPGILPWLGYATLIFWLWLATIRFFARRILGRHVAMRKPGRRIKGMKIASTILLWPLLLALMGGQLWIWPGSATGVTAVAFGVIGLVLYVILLASMLFALGIWQAGREGARRPRCPVCKSDPGAITIAESCQTCGKSLAPWLLIDAQASGEGAPV